LQSAKSCGWARSFSRILPAACRTRNRRQGLRQRGRFFDSSTLKTRFPTYLLQVIDMKKLG
jgi:hypothetical protein